MEFKPLKVTDLNNYIKRILSVDPVLKDIKVEGEISNIKFHSSGHIYFSLKDDNSKINCIIFKRESTLLKFRPENGMNVVVDGYISIYERDGKYQLYGLSISLKGIGLLHEKYEELKNTLKKKGLFDKEHKLPIPLIAKKIAVVTASTGAAIQDIISVIKRRNPLVDIYIFPSLVQGINSSESICSNIKLINNKYADMDIILLCRGGGSIEELWSFNEESVALSIYKSNIPIISGIGHETDYTISDYVADLRAPTPSAAAEIAVKNIYDLKQLLHTQNNQLKASIINKIEKLSLNLLEFNYQNTGTAILKHLKQEIISLKNIHKYSQIYMDNNLKQKQSKLYSLGLKIETLNPLSIINRGFGVITSNSITITTINDVQVSDNITVHLKDGKLECLVKDKYKESIENGRFSEFKSK